jgi:cell division protein FtsL
MILISAVTNAGCDQSADVARVAADRQARQNETMARLQTEVAAGAKQLVDEEGRARRQTLELHRDLQSERSQLAGGWNALQAERASIAHSRRTESVLAALVSGGRGALAGFVALAFAWLALFGLSHRDDSAQAACELMVTEWIADRPLLSGGFRTLPCEHDRLAPPAEHRTEPPPSLPLLSNPDSPQSGETP